MPRGANGGERIRKDEIESIRIRRFWKKVAKTDDCWSWTGAHTSGGYGMAVLCRDATTGKSKLLLAHRFSYALAHGEVAAGVTISQTCANKSCVRPEHLRAWTHADAMQRHLRTADYHAVTWADVQEIRTSREAPRVLAARYGLATSAISAILHNRSWHDPSYVPAVHHARGELHRAAKLTAEMVLEARHAHAAGATIYGLRRHYGVAHSTMWDAIRGTTWKDVPDAVPA